MPMGFKGYLRAPNKDHLIALSHERHSHRLRHFLSIVSPPSSWDSRAKGWVGPPKDQGQCGSCWCFSGTAVVEIAFYFAGLLKPDGTQTLSEEYTLSCGKNGGCNGDDNTNVLDWAKATGLPLTSDYGPYTASPGRCAYKAGMKLNRIDDWGFADSNGGRGVTPATDIKAAIMQYGGVGCAVAAGGSSFWDSGQGVDRGHSGNIDHDVALIGWDDSKGKVSGAMDPSLIHVKAAQLTCWVMRNSWKAWGSGCGIEGSGCAWMEEGADAIGTEAVWAVVHNPNPPPPPVPPTPIVTLVQAYQLAASGIDQAALVTPTLTADEVKTAIALSMAAGWPKSQGRG